MSVNVLLPAATALLAFVFCLALLDQWRERRHAFQLVWAGGMLFFAIAAACEAIAAIGGWNDVLYKAWYLTGAVYTAGWLGLGTAFLLGRTRFGYAFAVCLFLAGLFTFLTWQKFPDIYGAAGAAPVLYFAAAGVLALAVAIATYFSDERWPRLAAVAVVGASLLGLVLTVIAVDPGAGLRARPHDPSAGGRPLPADPAPADAVHEHHRRVRPRPGGDLLRLRLHAQEAGPGLLP